MRITLGNTGDTIVEVLIAVAVLGLIIGGGYTIATRSLNGVRIAQERSEATKVAESQVEILRSILRQDRNGTVLSGMVDGTYPYFCLTDAGVVTPITGLNADDPADLPNYPPACRDALQRYHVLIQPTVLDRASDSTRLADMVLFTTKVTWERSGGGGQESLNLSYRMSAND